MLKFDANPGCEQCSLYESAKNPGIPTRLHSHRPGNTRAILFLGQSPGFREDKKGKSFIGYTGNLLGKLITSAKLEEYADIYLSNACRCRPPQGGNESQSQIRACRQYLVEDVAKLQAVYDEVIIMALGAKACYSTLNISSLNETLKKQGTRSKFFEHPYTDLQITDVDKKRKSIICKPVERKDCYPRVFATFHIALLHPSRKPALITSVQAHFQLLLRYLKDEFIPNELTIEPELNADVPNELPKMVAADVETYGILAGVEQTVFHPVKSKEVDGIDYKYQVVTVNFTWEEDGRLRTAVYIFGWKTHRKKIRQWFKKISQERVTLFGQYFKFDLLYLYMSGDPVLEYWIDPRRLVVDDTLLWSFLYNEQQPEKGLKELSLLYGIADYSKLTVTGKSGNAKSCRDKNLHYYNCLDGAVTFVLRRDLKKMIADRYGKDSPKLSDTCAWMRNLVVWDIFDLEKNGSALNVPRLEEYHKAEETKCHELMQTAEETYGLKLAGKGSDAPLRQLMLDAVTEADLLSDDRVVWAEKTGKISIGVENVNLVKPNLKTGGCLQKISLFQEYKERSKIVSTYTGPLLQNPRRGIVVRNDSTGLVYPSWYPIPTYSERGGSSEDKPGGQIQGRFSCRGPGRQTEPQSIRDCSTSRFCGGKLVEYDVEQDHLRMAALLSGDPELMNVYEKEEESIHLKTAAMLFPDEFSMDFKREYPRKYKVAKNLNFLVIFRGGATAFQIEAREKVGVELDLSFCQDAIDKWYSRHSVYKKWQDKMINLAARQGYLELPTGWSRSFGMGHKNVAGQAGEVCNFLHQCPCAQITQSAHYKSKMKSLKYRLRSLVCLNIYDAIFVDIYPGEEQAVDEIVGEAMSYPPALKVFERWVGRTIPWKWERKEYKNEKM